MDIAKCLKKSKFALGKFIEEYLQKRENIAVLILVVDIRHDPSSNDKFMYDYMVRMGKPFFVVANKADKIAVTKVNNAVNMSQEFLNPLHDITFLPFSAERKIYCDAIWTEIEKYVF